jgi:hypothetical protein
MMLAHCPSLLRGNPNSQAEIADATALDTLSWLSFRA